MLEINGLTKIYKGGKKAVDSISLHVDSGDIFGFIGHNGAGKSTTIRCIVGVLGFDEGDIFVDGVSVRDNPLEAKKRIAYIPDNPDIYDYLNFKNESSLVFAKYRSGNLSEIVVYNK